MRQPIFNSPTSSITKRSSIRLGTVGKQDFNTVLPTTGYGDFSEEREWELRHNS